MEHTLEVLSCFEQFPVDYNGDQQRMPGYLAEMVYNADELLRSQAAIQQQRDELESNMLSLQRTATEIQSQLQKEREARVRAEAEAKALHSRNVKLEDKLLNLEAISKQSQAHLDLSFSQDRELLKEVTTAFLVQYEYLRNRKAFTAVEKLNWAKIKTRLGNCECLEDIYADHEMRIARKPLSAEFKDTGTMCQMKKVGQRNTGTNTEESVIPETPLMVTKESSEMSTNTEEPMDTTITNKPQLTDTGMNTMAPHRVTRATQASTDIKKTKTIDRSTLCLLLESSTTTLDEDSSSMDMDDIFNSTICALPDMLSEIGDLVVPKKTSSCQTEETSTFVTPPPTATRETLTDIYNISRGIEYRSRKTSSRRQAQEAVKSELLSQEGDLLSSRSLEEFEQYWSLAGRSLMGALLGVKQSNGGPELHSESIECFQRQLLQQQMVAKFLSAGPVKKAVSIPSVYAESEKSGYEREVEEGDGEDRVSNSREQLRSPKESHSSSSSRATSVDLTTDEYRVSHKRRRRSRVEREEKRSSSLTITTDDPLPDPSPLDQIEEEEAIQCSTISDPPSHPLHSPAVHCESRNASHIASNPKRSSSLSSSSCPRKRLAINRTVDRIMRSRSNKFKIKSTVEERRRKSITTVPLSLPAVAELKRIRLIKQQEMEQVQQQGQRKRLDSVGSEVDESRLESIRDFFNVPQFLDPILDGGVSDEEKESASDNNNDELMDQEEIALTNESSDQELINNCNSIEPIEITKAIPATDETETMQLDPTPLEHATQLKPSNNPTQLTMQLPNQVQDNVPESQFVYSDDCPASPPPCDSIPDKDHIPVVIHSESQVSVNIARNASLRKLKVTHTTINHFIQNRVVLGKQIIFSKAHRTEILRIVNAYLDSEWSWESTSECVDKLNAFITTSPVLGIVDNEIVQSLLTRMEFCEDSLIFEPTQSYAPYMPKTHQMVVLIVERLGLSQKVIDAIERRLFVLNSDDVTVQTIVNFTYLYLTLQDLEINKRVSVTRPLRLFLVKALYFYKGKAEIFVYMTMKAFPKLLPKMQQNVPFVVGGKLSKDPLVDVLICVLTNRPNDNNGIRSGHGDMEERSLLSKMRSDWQHLKSTFYHFTPYQLKAEEVLDMLMERMQSPETDQNVVHGILLLSKNKGVQWAKSELLPKELLPRTSDLMDSDTRTVQADNELCLCLTVIAGVVKTFPRTDDVSVYRSVFRRVLVERHRFSHRVQESAVMAILRLVSFGTSDAFNAVREWYAPTEHLSKQARAVIETFVSRQSVANLVRMSNEG